jgi:hypothetical protein
MKLCSVRPSNVPFFALAGAVQEDLLRRADEAREVRPPELLGELEEPGEPRRLLLLGHVVPELEGRGAGARRVLEGEDLREIDLADERERRLEVFFGLAREAHDHVGREGERLSVGGARVAQGEHTRHVLFAGVAPDHAPEHAVRARLDGHVHVAREHPEIAVSGDERRRGVPRVGARVPEADEPRYVTCNGS